MKNSHSEPVQTLGHKFCINCGGELTNKAKFCISCGKSVRDVSGASRMLAQPDEIGNQLQDTFETYISRNNIRVGYKKTGFIGKTTGVVMFYFVMFIISQLLLYIFGAGHLAILMLKFLFYFTIFITPLFIVGLFFRKYKVKTLGLDKIDITMCSSFSNIDGSEKIYTIELLFDNRNSKDKKTSIGQFIRYNQLHVHNKRNNLFYPICNKEYESVYLPQGKMKVIFKLVAANADDVLQYFFIKGKNPIIIPDNGSATVQDEIVLQQITAKKKGYYRNIKWSIIFVIIILVIIPIILVLGGILLLLFHT